MKPVLLLPLLLYLRVASWAVASTCPKDCSCSSPDTIICYTRQAPTIPSDVPASTKILHVFKNGIETLDQEDFIGLESLEMLDLSQNKLNELPDSVFKPLSSLRNLDLSSNQITHISQESFAGLELLERLYLHSNTIKSIHPSAFDGLEQLLELKLYRNELTAVPAFKMPNLLLLDLRFNKIPSPGLADLQTPKLESLKLGGLGLSTLNQKHLPSFKNLHELDISNNQLKLFPYVIWEARGLVRLNLAGNPIATLKWEHFENLTELQDLDISNLSLQTLPDNMTVLFPHMKKLTVAGNPFNCLCTLAWFPSWLHKKQILLGRTEETRCHFPLRNAGKVLERLGHQDFGCPAKTTISPAKTITPAPPLTTTLHSTTGAIPLLNPSDEPSSKTDSNPQLPVPASPSSSTDSDLNTDFCPASICLNGGTCWLDHQAHFGCICPSGSSGKYCENEEDQPDNVSTVTDSVMSEIVVRLVTSTSIQLDLNSYIERHPYIHGVKLTYRNLSGSDKRPKNLNFPAFYQEYTLRGLLPNSTYFICASPLNEPSDVDSVCTQAHTLSQQHTSALTEDPHLTTMLVPTLAILLLLVLVAVAVGVACYMHRKKRAQLHLYCDPSSHLELEGVKVAMDNGDRPPKQTDIASSQTAVQNDYLDYEIPLIQDCCVANNRNTVKPF